jgi:hypothetical protein
MLDSVCVLQDHKSCVMLFRFQVKVQKRLVLITFFEGSTRFSLQTRFVDTIIQPSDITFILFSNLEPHISQLGTCRTS